MDARLLVMYAFGVAHGLMTHDWLIGVVYGVIGVVICYGLSDDHWI